MINCNLRHDITLGNGNACMLSDINAGIQDGLYIFNLDDIKGLVFENDSRPDSTLFVDTIITSQPFYRVDATSIAYEEEYEDHNYKEKLTANIASVRNEIEEKLGEAVHGKYAVAFRVIGETHYRLAGWKEGLSLTDSLSITSEDNSFYLTFEGKTTYPLLEVHKSNFDLRNKVFDPMFEPLFESGKVVCSNGWAVAMYVVKVNAAGQALDTNNKLCQYSYLPQDAYKLSSASDGGYHIIGTYSSTDFIEGKAVRKYDTSLCNVSGSISVSPSSVILNSTNTQSGISVVSTDAWELVNYPSVVSISRTGGQANEQSVYLYGTNTCGSETLTFRNKTTRQTASLSVRNDIIIVNSLYTYPYATTNVTIAPVTCGSYTAAITSGVGSIRVNLDGTFSVYDIPVSDTEQKIYVNLTSGTEVKQVEIIINGKDTSSRARAIAEWCEIE